MRDWRASVRTWERNGVGSTSQVKPKSKTPQGIDYQGEAARWKA